MVTVVSGPGSIGRCRLRRNLAGQFSLELNVVSTERVADSAVVGYDGFSVIDQSLNLVGFRLRYVALLVSSLLPSRVQDVRPRLNDDLGGSFGDDAPAAVIVNDLSGYAQMSVGVLKVGIMKVLSVFPPNDNRQIIIDGAEMDQCGRTLPHESIPSTSDGATHRFLLSDMVARF